MGASDQSFEAIALPLAGDLYRAACGMCRNPAEAEDAVQETFLQAWKSFSRFEPGTNFRAWIFRILFHVMSHQKRKWYSRFVPHEREDLERVAGSAATIRENVTDEDILAALRSIPPQFAQAVMLIDAQGFTYKEAQVALSVPAGTIMSRLNRGRALLRARLSGSPRQK